MKEPPGCCSRSPPCTKRCTSPRGLLRVPSSAAPAPQAPPPRQPSPGWASRTFAEMKFGAPRAATSCRRREGCCCFPQAGAQPAPQPRAPSGGAARAPRGAACKRSLAPAGLLLPSPAPSLALAGHCLRAPAPGPAARPRPSPRPLARTQSFGGGGKCPGAGRLAAAAQDARGSLRLPQVHPTGCRRCSYRGVLGAAARLLARKVKGRMMREAYVIVL
ncbi:nematocyst expressed protein 3-like [Cavia porcellus]|uniref:nematocyst expressed protein 3-like n=1 Tax=Cavia porcellus TaxID=10141 RepID=UPI002FE1ED91